MATVRMRPCSICSRNLTKSFEIHSFVETVIDRLIHERMVGYADRTGKVLGAGDLVGENGGEQIVGPHALNGGRNPCSACENRRTARARVVFHRQRAPKKEP